MRKPRGFAGWDVPVGVLFIRQDEDGGWVVLAGDPPVKMDNRHRNRRPHLHVGGWNSDDRRDLRPNLTAEEAAEAVAEQLSTHGYIRPKELQEELS